MFKSNASRVAFVVVFLLLVTVGLFSAGCMIAAVAVPRIAAVSGSGSGPMHVSYLSSVRPVVDTTVPTEVVPLAPNASGEWVAQKNRIDLEGTWKFQEDLAANGYDMGWAKPEFDDSKWKDIKVPGDWESQGFTQINPAWEQADDLKQPYTGIAWYRKSVVIPADWKGKTVSLHLGKIDDLDWTRVNNRWIGETSDRAGMSSNKERAYTVPPEVIKWGQKNVIAIRVQDFRGLGGIVSGPVYITCAEKPGSISSLSSGNDAVQIGGSVTVKADQTVRDAVAVGGSVQVYGHVQGDVVAVGGTVHIYPGGRVDGDTVAIGGSVIEDPGSTRGGQKVVIGGFPWDWGTFMPWMHGMPMVAGMALGFGKRLFAMLLALLVVVLFAQRTEIVARTVVEKPGMSVLYGVLAWVLAVPVGLFLLVTCVGIPLIFVEIVMYMVAYLLGFAGLSLAVGWKLGEALQNPVKSPPVAVLLGGLTLALIGMMPILGATADCVLSLFGLGAVVITGYGAKADWIWNRNQNGSQQPVVPPPGVSGSE